MPSNLHKIQRQFLKSIFNKASNNEFIKSDYASERMAIYRETIMENLRKSLAITFPGTWKLLGDNCANAASYFFCKQMENLPKEGCLDFWGEKFPSFLGSIKELSSLPYLEDYARYEWIKHLSYINLSQKPILDNQFDDYNTYQMQHLRIKLQESALLFKSSYPVDDIENMLMDPKSDGFTLKEKPLYAIVTKEKTLIIEKGQYIFLKELRNNILAKAHQEVFWQDKYFDITSTFAMLLNNKLIVEAYILEEEYA